MVEKFVPDLLGRLTQYALYDSNGVNELAGTRTSLSYDALGNIKSKGDVGTYYYNASGTSSARPHAVAAVRGTLNNDYAYDANGNMTAGGGRSFVYTSYNMLWSVGNASTCHEFVFQSEHMRSQQTIYNAACRTTSGQPDNAASPVASRTLYLHPDAANGLSFEREQKGGTTTYKHFINAGGMVVGVLSTTTTGVTSSAVGAMKYFHYDHLGSVIAVSDSGAGIVERRSFDPWGRPRNLNGTAGSGELPGGLASATDRGFALHEHLEGLGIVHMNGRVFDPLLARFMSADPFVQATFDGQSYNRYSYLMNDPLDGTDPSGYFLKWLARKWRNEIWRRPVGRMLVVVAVGYFTGQFAAGLYENAAATTILNGGTPFMLPGMSVATTSAVIGGTVGGFAGGLVGSGGDLKSAAKSALTGGAFGFVGGTWGAGSFENYAGHAVVGCASAAMDGGKCGSGAASALLGKFTTNKTEGLNPIARGIAATVAGGVGAKITGGSFQNGAMTAAFGYLFNACGGRNGCKQWGTILGTAGGVLVAGGCDVGTFGACVLLNPAIVATGAGVGFSAGAVADWLDDVVFNNGKEQTPDQEALGETIREQTQGGRRPLTNGQADTVLGWAKETGVQGARDDRGATHWKGGPHIHVPGSGVNHIPVDVAKP